MGGHVRRRWTNVVCWREYRVSCIPLCHLHCFALRGIALHQAEREEHLRVQRMADAYSAEELGEVLDKYGAKSPQKNDLTKPFPFNLMFKVSRSVALGFGYLVGRRSRLDTVSCGGPFEHVRSAVLCGHRKSLGIPSLLQHALSLSIARSKVSVLLRTSARAPPLLTTRRQHKLLPLSPPLHPSCPPLSPVATRIFLSSREVDTVVHIFACCNAGDRSTKGFISWSGCRQRAFEIVLPGLEK